MIKKILKMLFLTTRKNIQPTFIYSIVSHEKLKGRKGCVPLASDLPIIIIKYNNSIVP